MATPREHPANFSRAILLVREPMASIKVLLKTQDRVWHIDCYRGGLILAEDVKGHREVVVGHLSLNIMLHELNNFYW